MRYRPARIVLLVAPVRISVYSGGCRVSAARNTLINVREFFFFWNPFLYTARVTETQKQSPRGNTVYNVMVGRACAAV